MNGGDIAAMVVDSCSWMQYNIATQEIAHEKNAKRDSFLEE